ncbi:MAG: MFS transporter [Alphaproteobacteria bacterium]|nr:MFS transporter [Alphaproteobacteria bacterium]
MNQFRHAASPPLTPGASLLGSRDFLHLWAVGGIANGMRWLEVLAAALFTLEVTGSPLAVAAVTAARTLPLIVIGGFAGVLADAVDRRRIVIGGMVLSAACSGAIAVLAALGVVRPWHLFLSSFISGLVYGTELSARRRMVGECVAPRLLPRAVALDSLTSSAARAIGPLLGGAAYEWLGLPRTFLLSASLNLFAAWLAARVHHVQVPRRLSLASMFTDIAEAFLILRRSPVLSALLGVTLAQNLFGWAYTSLVAPVGLDVFGVSASLVGVLAAAEPGGAALGGLGMALIGSLPGRQIWWLWSGSAIFLTLLATFPVIGTFWAALGVLVAAGLGVALYTNQQTTIALTDAPAAVRSRVMGLLTMAIGTWPLGQLLAGWLASRIGPLHALGALGTTGLAVLLVVAPTMLRRR